MTQYEDRLVECFKALTSEQKSRLLRHAEAGEPFLCGDWASNYIYDGCG
jgi:hypothetical protein